MQEKELISNLKKLRQIEPNKEWVSLTKSQILGTEKSVSFGWFSPYFKPAFAGLISVFVFVGVFGFAQNSLPGDLLYSVKKISERGQGVFVSEQEKPAFQLKIVNQRLEELALIVQYNQTEKLASGVDEFQASVAHISEVLQNVKDPEKIAEAVVEEIEKLKENKEKIEGTLAVKIGTEESEKELERAAAPYYKVQLEMIIADLETQILTEEKQDILSAVKELFEQERYSEAFELYLISQ